MIEQEKLIRVRMATTQSRQKSYADTRRRELTFDEGNWVYLKVSPMKGIKGFGLKGKFSPIYIRPYRVMEMVGPVAYRVWLLVEYEGIHNVFHISSLRRSFGNQQPWIFPDLVQLQPNLVQRKACMYHR